MFGRTRASRASVSCRTCSRSRPRGFFWFQLRRTRMIEDAVARRRTSTSSTRRRCSSSSSAAAGSARRRRRSRHAQRARHGAPAHEPPLLVSRARRDPLPGRDARPLPAAARLPARRRGLARRASSRERDGWVALRRARRPGLARELCRLMRAGATVPADEGTVEFRPSTWRASATSGSRGWSASSSRTRSVVFGDQADPEGVPAAGGRASTPSSSCCASSPGSGFPNIAALVGWYAYAGRLLEATLGILQEFVPGAVTAGSSRSRSSTATRRRFLDAPAPARRGDRRAAHRARARDPTDPDFCARGAERARRSRS